MATSGAVKETLAELRELRLPWATVLWVCVLVVAAYAPVLLGLVRDWIIDENMGHGFFVLPISLYLIWQSRGEWSGRRYQPSWAGLLLIAWAGAQVIAATVGAEFFLARTAFLIALAGCVVTAGGFALLRALAFPLFLLLFAIPLPAILYNQITLPLQLFSSWVAENVLMWIGIPVYREGNILTLPSQQLSVEEACSGIRSLLTLSFLSLVYGRLFDPKPWMKWALLAATVPIAIAANAARVTITGILSEINPGLVQGFMHTFEGWIVFLAALIPLVGVHAILNRIYRRLYGNR